MYIYIFIFIYIYSRHTTARTRRVSMPARPNLLLPPHKEDVLLALAGDLPARKRVKVQKCRFKKRNREIAQWDIDDAAR